MLFFSLPRFLYLVLPSIVDEDEDAASCSTTSVRLMLFGKHDTYVDTLYVGTRTRVLAAGENHRSRSACESIPNLKRFSN